MVIMKTNLRLLNKVEKIRKKYYNSIYSMSLDIGISYFTLYKFLHKREITDYMMQKIEAFVNDKT